MAYAERKSPRDRVAAIAGVAAIHAAIGAGLIVGMTVAGVAPPIDQWDPFVLTPEKKPTPPPPTPQPSQQATSTVIVAPLPPIEIRTEPALPTQPVQPPLNTVTSEHGTEILPTPSPVPTSTFPPRLARPSNNRDAWISNDDYPASALRKEAQGTVGYELMIGTNGRVSACDVIRSSGNAQLDDATCRLIRNRARFEPATDEAGAEVIGSFSGTVRWQIPD